MAHRAITAKRTQTAMKVPKSSRARAGLERGSWAELLAEGRALYSVLVVLGSMMHALQVLVMAIIMPTVVGDIGGAEYYTWASMLYTIGSIVGAAAVSPVWSALGGARRGYALSGVAFLLGTVGCAIAPNMAALNAARAVQGLAGGVVTGGSMALVGGLFGVGLRTRILAIQQGTFTFSHLLGPVIGGAFAQIGWWRGSFWVMVPIIVFFSCVAWIKIPDHIGKDVARGESGGFPLIRLALLAAGVFCVAVAGLVGGAAMRLALIVCAIGLIWVTFRFDRAAASRLYPSSALSSRSPVGVTLWILFLMGSVQATVTLFLPLLLQVVHDVSPLFISFVTIIISSGWTVGTFSVSGWAGSRERLALRAGPILMLAGLSGITITAQMPMLTVLAIAAFVFGIGLGVHNVHLVARAIAAAAKGEERITASSLPSIRSLGTAFGAALAGMLSTIAGLGNATEPHAVGAAVTFVYAFNLIPLAVAALLMFRLVRLGRATVRSLA